MNKTTLLYSISIFLGAFLLFQVQPIIGRYILPWFGGTPEVWTTCVLFFQLLLLVGYAYSHLSITRLKPRTQVIVHLALVTLALLTLPITPAHWLKPTAGASLPALQILLILTVTIGLPYFIVSTTGPLMQGWFAMTTQGKSPYRFYALSNAGSLLALLSYPFVFEPLFGRHTQSLIWSIGLGGFAVLTGLICLQIWKQNTPLSKPSESNKHDTIKTSKVLMWMALAAGAAVVLLAVTNKICQDVAVIPFLWVLPLSIYLLTFVICFDHPRWYVRPIFLTLFILGLIGVMVARVNEDQFRVIQSITLYCSVLFVCCMVCHGELYRIKPDIQHLTTYYLSIAAGGAAGGLFVAIIAPLIFNTYIELYAGLLACCTCVLLARQTNSLAEQKRKKFLVAMVLLVSGLVFLLPEQRGDSHQHVLQNKRNFFGVLTIWEEYKDNPQLHRYAMQHGSTFHGLQFALPEKQNIPTAYYGKKSGIGLLMETVDQPNRKIGAIGLGAGTVAAYLNETDSICFYEINPLVKELAEQWFTFLDNCKGHVKYAIGDGRLLLEQQEPQDYDILIVDAFNGDAVPIHLLTAEAFEVYLNHLKKTGVLAIHVSSIHLDLEQVVWKAAEHFGLHSLWIESSEDNANAQFASNWILLSKVPRLLDQPTLIKAALSGKTTDRDFDLWTDDHINLPAILKKAP